MRRRKAVGTFQRTIGITKIPRIIETRKGGSIMESRKTVGKSHGVQTNLPHQLPRKLYEVLIKKADGGVRRGENFLREPVWILQGQIDGDCGV